MKIKGKVEFHNGNKIEFDDYEVFFRTDNSLVLKKNFSERLHKFLNTKEILLENASVVNVNLCNVTDEDIERRKEVIEQRKKILKNINKNSNCDNRKNKEEKTNGINTMHI